jgi:TonB family protein
MNRNSINLIVVGFCFCLFAGCAARNPINESEPPILQEYDAVIFDTIQKKWHDILDKQKFTEDRSGKVVVQFHLNPNGSVSDLKLLRNDVGEVFGYDCEEAVYKASPFNPWPPEVDELIGKNFREITFTFNYR